MQETEANASVRGARLVLLDDDDVRANMTASWLAQMGWEVSVLEAVDARHFREAGPARRQLPSAPSAEKISSATLVAWREHATVTAVLDFSRSADYARQHIPGVWFVLRSQLAQALSQIPGGERYVLTCGTSLLAAYVVDEVAALTGLPVFLLDGGKAAWQAAGLMSESGETALASPRIDCYRRPYEGTDNPASAWSSSSVGMARMDFSLFSTWLRRRVSVVACAYCAASMMRLRPFSLARYSA